MKLSEEQSRVVALSLLRALYLSDHMGDAWNAVFRLAKIIGFEIPPDEDDDMGVDFDALEDAGALPLYDGLEDYLAEGPAR